MSVRRGTPQRPKSRLYRGLVAFFVFLVTFYSLGHYFLTRQIQENIRKRNLDVAMEKVELKQRFYPFAKSNWVERARVFRLTGDADGLQKSVDQGLRYGVDPVQLELENTLLLAQQGQLELVEDRIVSLLATSDSDTFEICDAFVNGLLSAGRIGNAETVISAWSKDSPKAALPIYRLARLREYEQKIADAKRLYKQAIDLQPDFYPASYSYARLLLDENEPEEAAVYFQKCSGVAHPEASLTGLAMSKVRLGETAKAKELFEQLMKSEVAEFRRSYRLVFEPFERLVAASEYGKLLVNDQEFAKAIEVLDRALKFNARDVTSRYSKSIALRSIGKTIEADAEAKIVAETETALREVNELRNAINRDNQDVESMLKLADILIKFESPRNGLFWLRNALSADSTNDKVHLALSKYYVDHATESQSYIGLSKRHALEAERLQKLRRK
ncbi:MAG: tetratricopeptide repeat protein [Pirellulales bacterium]